jgi:hypothetical protein
MAFQTRSLGVVSTHKDKADRRSWCRSAASPTKPAWSMGERLPLPMISAGLNIPSGFRTTTVEPKSNFFRAWMRGRLAGVVALLHVGWRTNACRARFLDLTARSLRMVTQAQLVFPREPSAGANDTPNHRAGALCGSAQVRRISVSSRKLDLMGQPQSAPASPSPQPRALTIWS